MPSPLAPIWIADDDRALDAAVSGLVIDPSSGRIEGRQALRLTPVLNSPIAHSALAFSGAGPFDDGTALSCQRGMPRRSAAVRPGPGGGMREGGSGSAALVNKGHVMRADEGSFDLWPFPMTGHSLSKGILIRLLAFFDGEMRSTHASLSECACSADQMLTSLEYRGGRVSDATRAEGSFG